ncbi:hypothetical protein PYW07_000668 [Mythimna separata]|uniref:E3 ubiquitin-protein ligase RNF220 middle domain-containing protein n=1 Tax=Mythimna separata TaxID=271217 RepID=A0AAD8E1L3_MYTSE|nr:hypothetical protein PYW07_000668 [Mythimna separata]
MTDGERKSSCGVCGARLGPGVAQAHFLQELQHLYSLSALPRDAAAPLHSLHHQDEDARWEVHSTASLPAGAAAVQVLPRDAAAPLHSLHHQDEDARWETYQRIRANRQRRLKLRTRKRHHTVESMLGYDLEDERREDRRDERPRAYDAEDEPVDVEGDSLGWPEAAINVDEKEPRSEGEKLHMSYAEDLEISSTNDAMQSPERVRIETPKTVSVECPAKAGESAERPAEVSTSEGWGAGAGAPGDAWPALAAEAYLQARHKLDGENLPSSTDTRN